MRGAYAAAVVALVGVLGSVSGAEADGAVGCLFKASLCQPHQEWCYNDYAFGRCLPFYGEDIDMYRYHLKRESLHQVKRELERLMRLGYHWGHLYTQCILKALMSALRYEKEFDEGMCGDLVDEDLNGAVQAFEGDENTDVDPQTIAQVKFTPSFADPHAEYADEVYYPGIGNDGEVLEPAMTVNVETQNDKPNYIADLRRALLKDEDFLTKRYQKRHRFGGRYPDNEEILRDMEDDLPEVLRPYDYVEFPKPKINLTGRLGPANLFQMRGGPSEDEEAEEEEEEGAVMDALDREMNTFSRNYNTPEKFRNGIESRDVVIYPGRIHFPRLTVPEEREYLYETFKNEDGFDGRAEDPVESRVYTEGGSLRFNDGIKEDDSMEMKERPDNYNNWGFKRRERLDVKKPGPAFNTNNYAFRTDKPEEAANEAKPQPQKIVQPPPRKLEDSVTIPEKKKVGSPLESPALRKQAQAVPAELKDSSENSVDTNYAYIQFKDRVDSWMDGLKIIRAVEELLNLRQNTFSHTRVDLNEVTFKVEPNRLNLNASEVARRIDADRALIKKTLGVEVTSTGVGDKAKLPTVMSQSTVDEHQLWILSFLLCGVIAAVAIAGAAFFVIRRHSRTRQKLQNMTQLDSEASKDYQDLCRARMATKSPQEKPEGGGGFIGHRITNLTRESEGSNHSPSSRSSTSSWSEEPALTNMDISTGHMVLSYMEDHLKNKDRLEQEWVALCAYEAEPCATTIALIPENSKKNRYTDILPYDHARVILNELSNVSGSDYINASTITDHDPRNPAYIATQGPLPQTAADFWQMVWEQGSVVMVMLSRLTENGMPMCHRYWPEEGSELYHIYEVHLVSEHIWCDDYLVRSFYLKNIKTGETRTVTQFHFLSWPENGVPLSTKALLEFRRKVNKSYRGRSCPIVVHCSDGVGRTGTYCLIDMVLNRMAKGAKEIDIAATLEHIRDQRPLMVRTKQQFEFVLMAVAEEVHAILKALPANHSPPPVLKEKE
ncbi:UNVERIFIED_CONTAM: hypothetical protein PYX00_010191 [Menopon gallinae]|uniref:Receptor-type tyrosine-protein phosphatase N2 n=1 Tax=Menopon gallinae TaxID=328185 RepID=A0AAW2HF40_9NEOP